MASKVVLPNGICKATIVQLRDGKLLTELVTRRGDFISKALTPFISQNNFRPGDVVVITIIKVRDENV